MAPRMKIIKRSVRKQMSQNVTINGISYTGVPSLKVKITNTSNYATFYDVSDTTATADFVKIGYYFYTANGTKTAGTMPLANGVSF